MFSFPLHSNTATQQMIYNDVDRRGRTTGPEIKPQRATRNNRTSQLPMYASFDSAPRLRIAEKTAVSSSTTLASHFTPRTQQRSFRPYYANTLRLRPRRIITFLKFAIPIALLLLIGGLSIWEPHIELAFYSRAWVQKEVTPIEPLAGCFNPSRVSNLYNMSEAVYGKKRTEVQAGIQMRMGMDCYDFAGTVQPEPRSRRGGDKPERVNFHTYWRFDLAPFTERQAWMLKSFFTTQDLERSKLILWSNGDLQENNLVKQWIRRFPDAFEVRTANVPKLSKGTALEGSMLLKLNDAKAWVDGDLIRLLLLWNFGGVWVDMDSLLTRDLSPLLEHEFVTQWDCYDKKYQALNGALMHFRQHSPYLCEAFHIMENSAPPRPGSTDWGSLLYLKLWRRLVAAQVPPFKILPFCFSDARSCRLDNRLPDPFVNDSSNGKWTAGLGLEEGGGLDKALQKVFSVHLHNQWEKAYPKNGWVERLLLKRYETKLSVM